MEKKYESSNPVGWFDLHVGNLERAKKFYAYVFQTTLADLPIEWGKQSFFPFDPTRPNISGALVEKEDFVPTGNNSILYFETEEITQEERRVVEAGGKILQPKINIGEFGFVSICMDSEGNTIGLHSRR